MDNAKFQELVLKKLELLDTLADNVTSLDSKVGTLTDNMANLDSRVDTLTDNVASLDSKVGTLTNDMAVLTSKVNNIDTNQVRLETEITEKIRALFDARQVSLDYFASIKNTLARIEASQESFRHMLYNVESKQREHDRELRLLRIEQK